MLDPHIPNYNPANPDAFDFGGSYLSGFIGYHGAWYYDEHSAQGTPFRTFAAGHIHVGRLIPVNIAEDATMITLRTLIDYITPLLPTPGDANIDGNVNLDDFNILAGNFGLGVGAVWEDADFTYDGTSTCWRAISASVPARTVRHHRTGRHWVHWCPNLPCCRPWCLCCLPCVAAAANPPLRGLLFATAEYFIIPLI